MKKIFFILFALLLIPNVSFAAEKKTAVLFYADWCPHCKNVDEFFKEKGFFEKYDIQKLNFDDKANKALLGKIFETKNEKGGAGIPALVVDDKLIIGDSPIIADFEKTIEASNGTTQDFIAKVKNENVSEKKVSDDVENSSAMSGGGGVPIWILLGAAFADAANPCALAVLILLLATVSASKGKNRALLSGLMFSLAIFISYLAMGMGIYKAIGAFSISKYLSLVVGVLAIVIALANFKDVFWYGKFFIMEVPLSWRPKMQEIIRSATSPWSAFGIGFLVSLFLVPCASGPYVVILGMLAQKVDMAKSFTLLILYNFVFVLPMILITLGMYFFNAKLSKMEKMRRDNLRLLHAITGVIMLAVGIYLIYTKI
ncbi:MAG: cytochrome c biogenesis protein transmembrane region [uncultured bacterium]|nr:MAG: cytochrome c biogenesis protein transmembrane region [uncultured bacterium]